MSFYFTNCHGDRISDCLAEADSKDKNITTLETVLNEIFTVPNKELHDFLEDLNNYTMIEDGKIQIHQVTRILT